MNFCKIQQDYYNSTETPQTGLQWTFNVISKLLIMIHKQWIYLNRIVLKRHKGGLKTKEGEVLTEEIMAILQEGKKELEEEDKDLLDNDWDEIQEWHGIQKKIWVRAIKEAK